MAKPNTPSVESILNTVIDAIIAIDEDGIIQSANPAVQKIFGYAAEELIGKNVSLLMPNPYAREHDGHLRNYLRTGQAKIIGIGREVVGKKKDGTLFPIYLGVNEGRREGNRRFFTSVIRDITEVKRYQDDLKKQSEFIATVLNIVCSLVLVLDKCGHIVNFNRACEDTTGYSFQEVAGRPFWDFFLTMEEKDDGIKNFLSADPKRLVNNFETVWLTKKGEKRFIAWSNSPLYDKDNAMEYIIATGIDITERRNLERMVLEITKKEQQRIGQELHDGLAQHLATTAIAAKVVERKLIKALSPTAPEIKKVVDMVNQAVTQTRELAQGLYALETRYEDLYLSLRKLVSETEKNLGVRCTLQLEADIRVTSSQAVHLYRIAREAVANAVKHGGGRNIKILLKKKGMGELELRVENDGKKFSIPIQESGLGLQMMRSRTTMLNGVFSIAARPGGGTVVNCTFPTGP